ncbi:MAG: BolA protein [Candidatus Tokpelaia sp. JSC189]|nr:MAG: BolA protein [Candidatus Tokpelaia sp. JSC189]
MSRSVQETIEKKLRTAFNPSMLDVINETYLHAGHRHVNGSSFDGSGETHFRIRIVSRVFSGMKRIERHCAINHILEIELNHHIHALVIEARAPDE